MWGTHMTKIATIIISGAAMLGLVGAAFAQGAPPTPEQRAQRAAETRASLFTVLGASFGPVGGMLRNPASFNAATASTSAARVEVLAGMIKEMTALDTSKVVTTSEARPIVWTERADFEKKADDLVKAATAFKVAAAGGDQAATLKAAGAVGGACKSCHDKFRDEKK